VAQNIADIAAIDCITWAQLQRLRPDSVAGLRVLDWTEASPGLPLITSEHTSAHALSRLANALLDLNADQTLAPALAALLIDGFEILPLQAYAAILDLEHRASRLGYKVLQ
jgi:ABC-type phosphate/phosphonate transport system substrate-binding protein